MAEFAHLKLRSALFRAGSGLAHKRLEKGVQERAKARSGFDGNFDP